MAGGRSFHKQRSTTAKAWCWARAVLVWGTNRSRQTADQRGQKESFVLDHRDVFSLTWLSTSKQELLWFQSTYNTSYTVVQLLHKARTTQFPNSIITAQIMLCHTWVRSNQSSLDHDLLINQPIHGSQTQLLACVFVLHLYQHLTTKRLERMLKH